MWTAGFCELTNALNECNKIRDAALQNGLCSFISDTNGLVLIIYNTSQCIGKCAATYFVKVMKSLK